MPRSQEKRLSPRLRSLGLLLLGGIACWAVVVFWNAEPEEWRIEDHYKVRTIPNDDYRWPWLTDDTLLAGDDSTSRRLYILHAGSGLREPLRPLNDFLTNFPGFCVGQSVAMDGSIGVYLWDEHVRSRRIFVRRQMTGQMEMVVSSEFTPQKGPGFMWPLPDGEGWFEFCELANSNRIVRVDAHSLDQVDTWTIPGSVWFVGAIDRQTVVTLPLSRSRPDSIVLQTWRLRSNGVVQLESKSINLDVAGSLDYAFLSPDGKQILWATTKAWFRPALSDSVPFVRIETMETRNIYVSDVKGEGVTRVVSWPDFWGSTARWMPSGKAIRFEFNHRWYVIDVR